MGINFLIEAVQVASGKDLGGDGDMKTKRNRKGILLEIKFSNLHIVHYEDEKAQKKDWIRRAKKCPVYVNGEKLW